MDIPLQEEEDSSDEEYCPDEDEEDETTEEVHITLTSYLKKNDTNIMVQNYYTNTTVHNVGV